MEISNIKRLDQAVINRIAAGEVIQRPVNALKELIENSLDAKSTNIQISVINGGLKLLEIQDNGVGIHKSDLDILCERFTTSKLREYEDLNTIATYGFRGEALASISHVAHLTILTKTANDQFAYSVSYVDGKMKGTPQPSAGNQGTQIVVEDLFYNMSVRKSALRSPAEEYSKVADVVGKYAVHNAAVGFCLKKSGQNVDIRTPIDSTHVENIRTVYGNSIARELIEFKLENDPFKFTVNGYITNVNYSSKKFNFLLFINHRLVDCQNLKKCISHIYSTYLPKNNHPFVYLSLEINPKNVDVNVHPTKHEVHFLNEDKIVELISNAVEAKLLGSNNARKFYTQSKLPEATIHIENPKEKSKVQGKDMVRTDFREQKLEKFFGRSFTSAEETEINAVAAGENQNVPNSTITAPIKNPSKKPNDHQTPATASVARLIRVDTKLTSVLQLRKEVEDRCHMALRDVFAKHVFVGCIDRDKAAIQHGTKLYLCSTRKIMLSLFYQFFIYNFQNFDVIAFSEPLLIEELALLALDLPEAGWKPEDGEKRVLAAKVRDILVGKRIMLKEYFSMEVDADGRLSSLPLLLENHTPDMSGLPMYILRLATEVVWEEEKQCFKSFARETALYYSQMVDETVDANWMWTVEHVFYPAVKDYFLPSKRFTENGAVLEIATLPYLYKVFERC